VDDVPDAVGAFDAEMDFGVPPAVADVIGRAADTRVLGYQSVKPLDVRAISPEQQLATARLIPTGWDWEWHATALPFLDTSRSPPQGTGCTTDRAF
jgi:hypothetical protein